ncbi:hypothetical protein N7G274_004747 [Stereocaulon virgatum]|uniref:Uncharacterized protein n=1 Tax=Stereocaulon virgatum TaxID=373712 RepID=A0ABR4AC44_9LECA
MNEQPYRMKFGKHKNELLHELPPSYRSWLIDQVIYADKEDLKAALIEGKYLAAATVLKPPPSTPTRKRKASESDTFTPPSSKKKLAICKEAKRNGTMLNYDGTTYILDFGTHAGERLSNVPSSYTSWLAKTRVYEKRPDLAAALREEGLLVDSCAPDTTIPAWKAPSVHGLSDSRFYDPLTQAPRWISDLDASRYFRLSEPLLSESGMHLVSEAELRQSTEFVELLKSSDVPKRWLYQVYVCAGRVGTVGGDYRLGENAGAGTVDEALRDFLEKNRRREVEIRDALGFRQ